MWSTLSLLCDEAASGKDYGELFAKLNMVLFGILEDLDRTLPNFSQQKLSDFIQLTLNELNQHLEGFALLRCAAQINPCK